MPGLYSAIESTLKNHPSLLRYCYRDYALYPGDPCYQDASGARKAALERRIQTELKQLLPSNLASAAIFNYGEPNEADGWGAALLSSSGASAGEATTTSFYCSWKALTFGMMMALGLTSAIFYYFLSDTGLKRYGVTESYVIFPIAVASVITNFLFNTLSFLDLQAWLMQSSRSYPDIKTRVLVYGSLMFAGAAALAAAAPSFFVGLAGTEDALAEALILVGLILGVPVYFMGTLNFYENFNAPFVQEIFWLSLQWIMQRFNIPMFGIEKNSRLAQGKSLYFNRLNQAIKTLDYASLDDAKTIIQQFQTSAGDVDKRLHALIQSAKALGGSASTSRSSSWYVRQATLGTGLFWGVGVIAQNYGHVVETGAGVYPIVGGGAVGLALASIAMALNLAPGLGFTFSSMLRFDLIELFYLATFQSEPQAQRLFMGSFAQDKTWSFKLIAGGVVLFLIRLAYICSGFGNDQVNYQGVKDTPGLGAWSVNGIAMSGWLAFSLGLFSNVCGAFVFNGAACEAVLPELMTKYGSFNDIAREGKISDKAVVDGVRSLFGALNYIKKLSLEEWEVSGLGSQACLFSAASSQQSDTTESKNPVSEA